MGLTNRIFNLCVVPSEFPPTVSLSQYDNNVECTAQLVDESGAVYSGLPSGCTAKVVGINRKLVPFDILATIDGSNVTFTPKDAATDCYGKQRATIEISNGDLQFTPLAIEFDIQKSGRSKEETADSQEFKDAVQDGVVKYLNQTGLANVLQDLFPYQYEEIEIASNEVNNGRYVRADTGATATSSAWSTSYYLSTLDCEKVLVYSPLTENQTQLRMIASVAFFREADGASFISAVTIEQGPVGQSYWRLVDVPPTATKMRVTMYTETMADYHIMRVYSLGTNQDVSTSITFSEARTIGKSGVQVKAGQTYRIYPIGYTGSRINFYSNGTNGSRNYVIVDNGTLYADLHCEVDGILCGYNTAGYIGTINFRVLSGDALLEDNMPKTYYVGENEAFPSLTELLLSLKGDIREKTIVIRSGEYDIFNEYKALEADALIDEVPADDDSSYNYSTGYMPYNVFVPSNTLIRGEGYVRLVYAPEASETTVNESKTRAPINVAGSMTLENVEIYCKNGRYCIHDDPLQEKEYTGSVKKYVNVKAVKGANDTLNGTLLGFRHCFGCGVPSENSYEFNNCYFETEDSNAATRTLYFHDRKIVGEQTLTEKNSSRIVVNNSVCKSASNGLAVFFGNIGAALNIRVNINSCHIIGDIRAADEGDYRTGTKTNSFNISVLRTTFDSIVVTDASNPHPPAVFE